MKVLFDILLVILTILIQSSLAEKLSLFGTRPDFPLLLLVYIGIFRGQVESTALGFLIGFIQDVYSPANFGANALAKSLVGFGVGYSRTFPTENFSIQLLLLFSTILVHDFIYFLLYSKGDVGYTFSVILSRGFPTAIYTLLFPIAFWSLKFVFKNRI